MDTENNPKVSFTFEDFMQAVESKGGLFLYTPKIFQDLPLLSERGVKLHKQGSPVFAYPIAHRLVDISRTVSVPKGHTYLYKVKEGSMPVKASEKLKFPHSGKHTFTIVSNICSPDLTGHLYAWFSEQTSS